MTVQKPILNPFYARLASGKKDKNSILDCNKQEKKDGSKNSYVISRLLRNVRDSGTGVFL